MRNVSALFDAQKTLREFVAADIYSTWLVEQIGRRPVAGGVPLNPDVAAKWLATRADDPDVIEQALEQVVEDTVAGKADPDRAAKVAAAKADALTEITIGFRKDETGLFLRVYNLNAMFREAASATGLTTTVRGSKQVIQHGFFIRGEGPDGDRVYLRDLAGNIVKEPTGVEESVVHAMTAQGKIAAIRRFEFVFPWTVRYAFDLIDPAKYLKDINPKAESGVKNTLSEKYVRTCMTLAQDLGLGANRTAYYGSFECKTLTRVDEPAEAVKEKKAK